MILSDLNTNVHKSVNQFLIDATDAYIRKLEGSELTNEEKTKSENCRYITREDLDKIRREIKEELQREMIIILGSALAGGSLAQFSAPCSTNRLCRQTVGQLPFSQKSFSGSFLLG